MNYLRYHIASGIILSSITSETLPPAEIDPAFALFEGQGFPEDHWISDNELVARTPYDDHTAIGLTLVSADAVPVITGLPDPCWVRIRGTANMRFSEQLHCVEGGALSFPPALAGQYIVQLMGQYVAPGRSFEAVGLADFKQRRNDEISTLKAVAVLAGVEWNGHRWDTSPAAQLNLSGIASSINSGLALPNGFYWTDFANEDVAIDAAGVLTLGQAVIAFNFAVHDHSRTLKQAIQGCSTLAEVTAIDVADGWPA
jgi:hypothetical protein